MYSIAAIQDPDFLTAAYQKSASIHANNPLFDFYERKGMVEERTGDIIEMLAFEDTRRAAPVNRRGSPARTLDMQGVEKVYFTPIHAFNEIDTPVEVLEFIQMPDSPIAEEKGMLALRRQFDLFGKRHSVLRAVSLAKALTGGLIYFDTDGNILESSSGAAISIDLGVAATHKSQLAHASNGSSDIIDVAWDSASAKILRDLEQIREAAEYDKAPMPKHVWMHTAAKQWFRDNTELKSFLTLNSPLALQAVNDFLPQNELQLGDWTFHFTATTYVGADGSTVRPLIPKTGAIITPDPGDGDWLRQFETSELIPSEEGITGSLEEAMGRFDKKFGDFAYFKVRDNPGGLSMRMGMNFLYCFADPNAVWYATVDF